MLVQEQQSMWVYNLETCSFLMQFIKDQISIEFKLGCKPSHDAGDCLPV